MLKALRRTLVPLLLLASAPAAFAENILFIGNSFTFGAGSPVAYYERDLIHDFSPAHVGGVPVLFAIFARESHLNWDVSAETSPGQPLSWHLAHAAATVGRRWDTVILQDYSILDPVMPGDPTAHIRDAQALATLVKTANPAARIFLETTWPRADLIYLPGKPWSGQTLEAMTADLARGDTLAISKSRDFAGIVPVGPAWVRAIRQGLATQNPYEGVPFGKIDLWTFDHYHASSYGYYLAALVLFGRVTGVDPRTLPAPEKAANELGLDPTVAIALQRVAADELAAGQSTDTPIQ
jgi:hypothetical protein